MLILRIILFAIGLFLSLIYIHIMMVTLGRNEVYESHYDKLITILLMVICWTGFYATYEL